jgi:hypothetical protein
VNPGPFFYIAITVYHLLALFTFLQTTIFYHSIRLILCLHQIDEIDNLTVSWDKVLGCVVCRFHPAAGAKLRPGQGAIIWSCRKASEHQPSEVGSFSYLFDKPRSHTEGRLAAVLIITFSWGFQLGGHYKTPTSTPHHHTDPCSTSHSSTVLPPQDIYGSHNLIKPATSPDLQEQPLP